jgi:antitoxin (DNA-binding transcriptional repressor) of toxin-antitoxin stability system
MTQVSLRELQRNAPAYLGQEVIITRYNIPVARLVPITVGEIKSGEKISEKKIPEILKIGKEMQEVQDELQLAKSVPVPSGRCRFYGCREVATTWGRGWNDVLGEVVDVEMCEKHALKSKEV